MLQNLEGGLAVSMSGRHGCVLCDVFLGERRREEREEGEESLINLGTNFLNLEI